MNNAIVDSDKNRYRQSDSESILNAPIIPGLLRLALPIVIVSLFQVLARLYETRCMGVLGTDTLAGFTLVVPILFLMNTLSNGGIGGGVSSAIARAMGANKKEDVEKLLFHSLLIAISFGAVFTLVMLFGGPFIYRSLGGTSNDLKTALFYSNIIFLAAVPIWSVALLGAALRGLGDMSFSVYTILGECIAISFFSPALMLGYGSFDGIGIIGSALVYTTYHTCVLIALVYRLRTRNSLVRLRITRLELRYVREILRIGGLSAVGTLQGSVTLLLITAAVGRFGEAALAGYGVASRIDALLVPILFGFGTVIVAMIGSALGAGNQMRAGAIARVGIAIGFCLSSLVGTIAALYPDRWLRLFSDDHDVIKWGADYLEIVAPFYGFFGVGLMMYFAAQGFGHVGRQLIAGSARFLIAGGGSWLVVSLLQSNHIVAFRIVAVGICIFGALSVGLMKKQIFPPRNK